MLDLWAFIGMKGKEGEEVFASGMGRFVLALLYKERLLTGRLGLALISVGSGTISDMRTNPTCPRPRLPACTPATPECDLALLSAHQKQQLLCHLHKRLQQLLAAACTAHPQLAQQATYTQAERRGWIALGTPLQQQAGRDEAQQLAK